MAEAKDWGEIYKNMVTVTAPSITIVDYALQMANYGVQQVEANQDMYDTEKVEALKQSITELNIVIGVAALTVLPPLLSGLLGIADVLSVIWPLVLGVGGAFGVFQFAANWIKITTTATKFGKKVMEGFRSAATTLSAGFKILRGGTAAATVATTTFNATLLASPITWVVMGIMVLIGIIYAAVAAFNKLTGSSVSATGLICGAFAALGAYILNVLGGIVNSVIQSVWNLFVVPFLGIIEFVQNIIDGSFEGFWGIVANFFGGIFAWILGFGKGFFKIIDAVLGTDLTSVISGLQDSLTSWGKKEGAMNVDRHAPDLFERIEYGKTFDSAYDWGDHLADQVNPFQGEGSVTVGNVQAENATVSTEGMDVDEVDSSMYAGDAMTVASAGSYGMDVNVVHLDDEPLGLMRDFVAKGTADVYTTANVQVEVVNYFYGRDKEDAQVVVRKMVSALEESLESSRERAGLVFA